jgi:uncharacterized protein with HEPN domain
VNERDRFFLAHMQVAIASAALTAQEGQVPWRQIAGTRDRLIHAYFKVDLDAVWAMVEQDLPTLRTNVLRIQSDNSRPNQQ